MKIREYFLLPLLIPVLSAQAPPNLAELIAAHPPGPRLAPGQHPGEQVAYRSGPYTLRGRIYVPPGKGPFPAVLWNHGSNRNPGEQPELAAFYTGKGFVFFTPVRHGHGGQAGDYIVDLNNQILEKYRRDEREAWKRMVRLHDDYNVDVAAAVEWLKARPEVDPNRIIVTGVSYGGIQTLLAAEKGMGAKAFISFAPGAMSWRMIPLRERLLRAVANAHAPIFLLQAANDYSTGPVEVLGAAIRKKGAPNQSKLYPAFGPNEDHQLGHAGFAVWNLGTQIWGADALAFIDAALRLPR
jgi:dienelactone hydrolase